MTELLESLIFAVLLGVWLAFGVKLWAEFFDRYGGF